MVLVAFCGWAVFSAGVLSAQTPPPVSQTAAKVQGDIVAAAPPSEPQQKLATLQQAVAKTTADWSTLANSLETRISRMLPCDPRMRTAIEEVSHASDVRMTTLLQYIQAAALDAKQQTEVAKRLLDEQESFKAVWNNELVQTQQEKSGVDAQISDLEESAKRRPALGDAQKTIAVLGGAETQRTAQASDANNRAANLPDLLRNLFVADQARQAAFEAEVKAVTLERVRWGVYYGARLSRAQAECTVTDPAAAAPARSGRTR